MHAARGRGSGRIAGWAPGGGRGQLLVALVVGSQAAYAASSSRAFKIPEELAAGRYQDQLARRAHRGHRGHRRPGRALSGGVWQRLTGLPMASCDHFRVGTITKTFTATVILKLVQQGRLHLNWTIARWEPKVPNAKRITIGMLLNMTSGIWDEGGTGPL